MLELVGREPEILSSWTRYFQVVLGSSDAPDPRLEYGLLAPEYPLSLDNRDLENYED